jgi:hypothetical protein
VTIDGDFSVDVNFVVLAFRATEGDHGFERGVKGQSFGSPPWDRQWTPVHSLIQVTNVSHFFQRRSRNAPEPP